MKTVFESCVPREEVLEGELQDEMFAARLRDVIEQTADPVYGDPRRFFENTYPTEGLKTLIHEVLGRLSGKAPSSSPFIRLETSFGGGKTHNLIALYHLAQGHSDGLPKDVVEKSWVPKSPWVTAGLVGSDMDPSNGIDHGDVTTQTIWGEIAFQMGGKKGYKFLEKSDKELLAPGTQVLEKLIGDKPALIMLDELARYLRTAKGVQTPNKKSDLAEQTVAFECL